MSAFRILLELIKDDGGGSENWSDKRPPVKTSSPINQHPVFLQTGCPSCRPTNSFRALKGKDVQTLQRLSPLISQNCSHLSQWCTRHLNKRSAKTVVPRPCCTFVGGDWRRRVDVGIVNARRVRVFLADLFSRHRQRLLHHAVDLFLIGCTQ